MGGANIGEPPLKVGGHPCGPHGYAPERVGTAKPQSTAEMQNAIRQRASLRMENPSQPRRSGVENEWDNGNGNGVRMGASCSASETLKGVDDVSASPTEAVVTKQRRYSSECAP